MEYDESSPEVIGLYNRLTHMIAGEFGEPEQVCRVLAAALNEADREGRRNLQRGH